MSKIVTTLGATAFVVCTSAYAVNPNSGQTSTSQNLNIEITSPASGANVDIGMALPVEGRVNLGAVPSTGRSNVVFVIDVSGSTANSGNDCNNDGQVNGGDNFTPADSSDGTILDCEVGAVMALNDSLGSNASVSTAIVAFGSRATTARNFVTPPNSDNNGNGATDIDDTLVQLDQGGGVVSVGSGTNFNNALIELTRLMNTRPAGEQRVAYFLTDGRSSTNVTANATAARDAGIRVETFSVGNSAAACSGSTLADIADITGGTCTDVQDINTLSAVISNSGGLPPTGIDRVTVSINGGAASDVAVDNLGNWDATIAASDLASGANTLEATVFAQDGTAVIADLTFNATSGNETGTGTGTDTGNGNGNGTDTGTGTDTSTGNGNGTDTGSGTDTSTGNGNGTDTGSGTGMAVTTPICASAASDPDGDGWGFENGQSCRVSSTGMGTGMGMMGPAYCTNGSASDHDGDGWGWENNMSCLVQGSTYDVSRMMYPLCTEKASDSDGNGWGWENNASCIVPGSAAATRAD